MDIVGIVPTGAKETDVVIVENNARSIFRPLGDSGMLFPPKASVNKLSVTEKTVKEPKTNKSDVRITKGKDINVIKDIQLKSPKNTGKTKTSLKKDYSENAKKVKAVYITRGITQRGEAGNPFTASPATNYTNAESSEKKKKGISIRSPKLESKKTLVKQKNKSFSKKITIGSPTKSPVSRISSTSRSYSQSLTKPSESFSRVSSPSKTISSISSMSVSKSSSASKSSSSSKSMSKSSSKSGSSSRSVSKSTSRSGSSGRSGSSSSLPKATPTIRSQRRFKANGIILPKNKDRKEEELLKKYSKENVEIPIVRGEEVLSGKKLKKFELPANKKTVLQINNKIYVQKPQKAKKAKKQQKKKNKF